GLRNGSTTIPVPSRTDRVLAARNARVVTGSRIGSSGSIGDGGSLGSATTVCSETQIDSSPTASALSASSINIGREVYGPELAEHTPIFTGRSAHPTGWSSHTSDEDGLRQVLDPAHVLGIEHDVRGGDPSVDLRGRPGAADRAGHALDGQGPGGGDRPRAHAVPPRDRAEPFDERLYSRCRPVLAV